jgi:hypothetical protein
MTRQSGSETPTRGLAAARSRATRAGSTRSSLLPKQLKDAGINASVFPYGYSSDITFSKAVTDMDDEAATLLARLDGDQ